METDEQVSKSLPELESIQSDSRAESPSSPLPLAQLECRVSSITAVDSAFQRFVPFSTEGDPLLHPFKPKAEDVSCNEHSTNMYTAKLPVKRKPKHCAPVSFDSSKAAQTVETHLSALSGQQSSDSRCNELSVLSSSLSPGLPTDHGTEASVRPIQHPLKMKCRKGGHLPVNRTKPVLTKVEIEARRIRRLQANRESARQALRKKQMLCQELSQKAATLKFENEAMKKEKEQLLQEFLALSERNRQLKEQLIVQSGSELGHPLLSHSTSFPSQQISLLPLQFPMIPYGGVPLQPVIQYFALSQDGASSQTSTLLECDLPLGKDYNSATNSNGLVLGLWMRTHGDSQPFLFPRSSFIDQLSQLFVSCSAKEPSKIDSLPASSCQALALMTQKDIVDKLSEVPVQNSDLAQCGVEKESGSQCAQTDVRATQLASENASSLALDLKSGSCRSDIAVAASTSKRKTGKVNMPKGISTLTKRHLEGVVTSGCGSHTIMQAVTGSSDRRSIHEGSQETCSYTRKKFPAAAAAAAEARRKRKELTRSKILYSRQLRLPC
eukprot:c24140_g1_i1 orf=675-2330(-)